MQEMYVCMYVCKHAQFWPMNRTWIDHLQNPSYVLGENLMQAMYVCMYVCMYVSTLNFG
jgi:hypothetical protein